NEINMIDKNLDNILSKIPKKRAVRIDDVVYGEILQVNDNLVFVKLDSSDNNVVLSPSNSGIMFVEKISNDFTKKCGDLLHKGDYIKARVVDINPFELKLTTAEEDLGVIKTTCSQCKKILTNFNNNETKCLNCGLLQYRKIAINR
ncbi:MAG: exosome complex RNA-binding protein Csl4, partial [archaeon]